MDLRQLTTLTAVADHRSFSGAARALHTVQSNVSTHIARLEKEVGAVLVDRSTGTLTPAGEIVVERTRRIHAELDAITADVASSLGRISGPVRFGIIGTTGRWLLPVLLKALADRHPGIGLITIDATTTSLVPQLAARTLDLALVNLPVDDPDISTDPLFYEDHVVLCPHDHPLADTAQLDLVDLAETPLLLEPPGTGFRDHLDLDAERAGIELVARAEIDGIRMLASLVHQGVGAAILPASAVQAPESRTRAIPLTGTTPRAVGLAVSRRTRLTSPATATVETLRHLIRSEVPDREGLELIV